MAKSKEKPTSIIDTTPEIDGDEVDLFDLGYDYLGNRVVKVVYKGMESVVSFPMSPNADDAPTMQATPSDPKTCEVVVSYGKESKTIQFTEPVVELAPQVSGEVPDATT